MKALRTTFSPSKHDVCAIFVRFFFFVIDTIRAILPPVSDILLPKCVKIVSINTPLDDPTRASQNYGLHADKKKAVLSDKPEIFKVHKGLLDQNGTISLEALFHPGYFLRHKNYQFHLEKEVKNSMFSEYWFLTCLFRVV